MGLRPEPALGAAAAGSGRQSQHPRYARPLALNPHVCTCPGVSTACLVTRPGDMCADCIEFGSVCTFSDAPQHAMLRASTACPLGYGLSAMLQSASVICVLCKGLGEPG